MGPACVGKAGPCRAQLCVVGKASIWVGKVWEFQIQSGEGPQGAIPPLSLLQALPSRLCWTLFG